MKELKNTCGECIWFKRDKNLNHDEGHCKNPLKTIKVWLYWRPRKHISTRFLTVNMNNMFCNEFESK